MKRRFLPMFLAAVMTLGAFSVSAMAEEPDSMPETGIAAAGEEMPARDISESDSYPIIIIPGIMGSKLYKDEGLTNLIWVDKVKLVLGGVDLGDMRISNTLYTKGFFLEGEQKEYGTIDVCKELVDFLCGEYGSGRDIYLFSYDWRKSGADAAAELKNVMAAKGITKADFICHSAGGQVMGQYANNDGNMDSINKVICLGSPFEGSPKLVRSVLTNYVTGDRFSDTVLASKGMTKDIKVGFPGVGEMAPTSEYWSATDKNAVLTGTEIDSGKSVYKLTYDESAEAFAGILKSMYGESGYSNIISEQNNVKNGINKLIDTGNAYFAIGDSKKTVTGIILEEKQGGPVIVDMNYGQGDGVVPIASVNMLGSVNSNFGYFGLEHTALAGSASSGEWANLKLWIKDILDGNAGGYIPREPYKAKYTVIRVSSSADAKIELNGSSLNSASDNYSDSASFGQMDVIGENEEIKMFCVDSGKNYNITLTGNETGKMTYTLRFYDENGVLEDERTFVQVPVTANTVISTKAVQNKDTVLNVDKDNDGKTDSTWTGGENAVVFKEDKNVNPPTPSGGGGGGGGGGGAVKYTLTYETNGGTKIANETVTSGTTVNLEGKTPTKEGFAFTGWYSDKELKNKITSIEIDSAKTVYAGWEEINKEPVKPDAPEENTPLIIVKIDSRDYKLNGKDMKMDSAPFIDGNDRTMLPVRVVANALGISDDDIGWDNQTKTASFKREDGKIVSCTVNSNMIKIGDEEVEIDTVPVIRNDRIYLPMRALFNAFNVSDENIIWDGAARTVTVTKKA